MSDKTLPWRLEEVDFSPLKAELVQGNERLFYLVGIASFVESLSDLYTQNLIEHYASDEEACLWLQEHWEPEELQHGKALRAYAEAVWPDFAWEEAWKRFAADYGAVCTKECLEPSRALEMAARCVVETGTSTFYRALMQAASDEPVLCAICAKIRSDEVRHFKYFLNFFHRYQEKEKNSFFKVMKTLTRRVTEVRQDDTFYAYRALKLGLHPEQPFSQDEFKSFFSSLRRFLHPHYPHRQAAEMLLSPLPAPSSFKARFLRPVAEAVVRRVI